MADKFFNAYNSELVALIKAGYSPEEAKSIADSHIGNYDEVVKQVASERKSEKEFNTSLFHYANELVALIKAGHSPEDAKSIADSHIGNYKEVEKQVAKERKSEKEFNALLTRYTNELVALMKDGYSPEEAVKIVDTHAKNNKPTQENTTDGYERGE